MKAVSLLMAMLFAVVGMACAHDGILFASPDKRFSLRTTNSENYYAKAQVVQTSTLRVVADLSDDIMQSEPDSLKILWAPDSKSFAANYQAGARYSTTAIFRWNGKKFAELVSPESLLYKKYIYPCKCQILEEAGKSGSSYLRRILDDWETVKWIDDSTVEINGASTSSYFQEDSRTVNMTVTAKVRVKFEDDGKARITRIKLDPPLSPDEKP